MNTVSHRPHRWAAPGPQIRHFTYPVLTRLDEADKPRRLSVDSWRYLHALEQVMISLPLNHTSTAKTRPHHFSIIFALFFVNKAAGCVAPPSPHADPAQYTTSSFYLRSVVVGTSGSEHLFLVFLDGNRNVIIVAQLT